MSVAKWLSEIIFSFSFASPCECHPAKWVRFAVDDLWVRECGTCGATWSEPARQLAPNEVVY